MKHNKKQEFAIFFLHFFSSLRSRVYTSVALVKQCLCGVICNLTNTKVCPAPHPHVAYVTQIITQLNIIFKDKWKMSCDFAIPHQWTLFLKTNCLSFIPWLFYSIQCRKWKGNLKVHICQGVLGSSCAFCNPQIVSYFLSPVNLWMNILCGIDLRYSQRCEGSILLKVW